jgi:hypothetical protein
MGMKQIAKALAPNPAVTCGEQIPACTEVE